MKTRLVYWFAMSAAVLAASTASAASTTGLARVGPTDPAHGYPTWYQDANGLALQLCVPDATELASGICLVDPTFLPDPSKPDIFPDNFSDEHFWFEASAAAETPVGDASLGLALEAAFNGPVMSGGQIAFGRIRIRIDVPAPGGTYTVTHPYGVEVFPNVVPGGRAINFTEDVGIACPVGDFTCALQSRIGPFLRPAITPGGNALPPININGKTYIADPSEENFVTGSPFGTNVFRIEGPNIGGPGVNVLEVRRFNVMGRVHTERIPSPLTVERATYARSASTAKLAVFATAGKSIGADDPKLAITGANVTATPMEGNGDKFFGKTALSDPHSLPATVTVTNSGDNPPSSVEANLVDEVRITQAHYNPASSTLKIAARSSDLLTPPQLVADGYGALTNGTLLVESVAVPPPSVHVRSAAGGSANVAVTISTGAVAVDDTAITLDSQPVTINVLANDTDVDVATVRIASVPGNGTVSVDQASGTVTYTPKKYFIGTDHFSYAVKGLDGIESNAANVTVTIQQRRR